MSFFPFGFSLPTANVESNNVAELLQQQIQQEMQAFLLMQQRNSEGNTGSTNGNSSSIFPDYVESSVWNWNLMQMQENVQQQTQAVQQDKLPEEDGPKEQKNDDKIQASPEKKEIEVLENESKVPPIAHPPMLDKRWEFVSTVPCFTQFEQLRCEHQVSRNRTFAYGIRYSCTQKTQMRSNCPYLLVCIFADGAGEHTPPGVGKISVYSRNKHTHPVKTIKKRQPRQKPAKKVEETVKMEKTEGSVEMKDGEGINGNEVKQQEVKNMVEQKPSDDLFAVLSELSRHFATTEQK